MRGVRRLGLGRIVGGAHIFGTTGRELDGTRAANGSFKLIGGKSFRELQYRTGLAALGLWSDDRRVSA